MPIEARPTGGGAEDRVGRLGARAGAFLVLAAMAAALGCASGRANSGARTAHGEVVDSKACDHICAASAACGDQPNVCGPKCNEWLVERSRPGIASATARCAVPRIGSVCEQHATAKGAATALVSCIDEAGRAALGRDNSALLVAARAICSRGARCNDASSEDVERCVTKIATTGPAPRGLGVFGAIKPELVQRFAMCMSTAECGGAGGCFGQMLGEDNQSSPDDESNDENAPPPFRPTEDPAVGGTKI